MSTSTADEAARALARWLAPFLADELEALTGTPASGTPARASDSYDPATCAVFVSTLGDVVLANAETFFAHLAGQGEIGSLTLTESIGVGSPRNIPSVLTTPLKRRAKALGITVPWREDARDERTVWVDHDGLATRMLDAIRAEQQRRKERT